MPVVKLCIKVMVRIVCESTWCECIYKVKIKEVYVRIMVRIMIQ